MKALLVFKKILKNSYVKKSFKDLPNLTISFKLPYFFKHLNISHLPCAIGCQIEKPSTRNKTPEFNPLQTDFRFAQYFLVLNQPTTLGKYFYLSTIAFGQVNHLPHEVRPKNTETAAFRFLLLLLGGVSNNNC